MNKLLIIIGFLVLGVGIFIGIDSLKKNENSLNNTPLETSITDLKPERKSELYGKVKSLEGNLVTITLIDLSQDPTAKMAPTEKRKYMQSLSEAERMALKEKISQALLGDTKILIPIGIPISMKKAQGPDAPELSGSLADITPNKLISVWLSKEQTNNNVAEFVKISFSR